MPKNKERELIDILINLEPAIKKAGILALKMQKNITVSKKLNTGIYGVDIVTEADLKVQEMILSEFAKTELNQCRMAAEENTPSINKFKNKNGFILCLDPIDGTVFYSSKKKFFSIIVSLINKKDILYTYNYFPALKWGYRILGDNVKNFGKLPKLPTKIKNTSKIIVHWFRDSKEIDFNTFLKLTNKGYTFSTMRDVTDYSGACTLFYLNKVAGFFTTNPNLYDGLVGLHYAKAKKFKIISTIDMSKSPKHGPRGFYYPGWYIVLRK